MYIFNVGHKNENQSYNVLKGIHIPVNLLTIQISLSSLKNRNMTFSLNRVLELLIRHTNRQKLWEENHRS